MFMVGITAWLLSSNSRLEVVALTGLFVAGFYAVFLKRGSGQQAILGAFAILYISMPLGLLAALNIARGWRATVLLIATVVVSDSLQFYSGRLFGRHALAPAISPKKTIEGAIGGAIAGTLFMVFAGPLVFPDFPRLMLAVLGFVMVRARNPGRPVRVAAEARGEREGQLVTDSRPRWRPGSDRRAALRDAGICRRGRCRAVKRSRFSARPDRSAGARWPSSMRIPHGCRWRRLRPATMPRCSPSRSSDTAPRVAAMATAAGIDRLRSTLGSATTTVVAGPEGLLAVATHPDVDIVICASAGTAGLEAVLAAIEAGRRSRWRTRKCW